MVENRDWKGESKRLCEIGKAIAAETDLDTLLDKIVTGARELSQSDAASLYIVEKEAEEKKLRFAVTQNATVSVPFKAFTMPISTSTMSGYVAATGMALRIPDVYTLPEGVPYAFSDAFDKKIGYRTKSMLVVPMENRGGETVGVLQLINKMDGAGVIPYDDDDVDILSALAAQAGILIERAALYRSIERLLRGFVEAAAQAIESRDKTTSGHSKRIATYMVVLAKRMTKASDGPFALVRFTHDEIREIFYASLLHDIGKIGVREHVLLKADKVSPSKLESIQGRFYYLIEKARQAGDEAAMASLAEDLAYIEKINKPGFLKDEDIARIDRIAKIPFTTPAGATRDLLNAEEHESFCVRKGNLTEAERKEIESHVWHSIEFLKRIPWTPDLSRVTEIAGSHHEKLNGKGYPFGLTGEKIPFEGKMMCIIDIFEALTALDRPYKPPMPVEKAIDILRMDAKAGALDPEILEYFVKERVWEVIPDEQRRTFTLTGDEILALE